MTPRVARPGPVTASASAVAALLLRRLLAAIGSTPAASSAAGSTPPSPASIGPPEASGGRRRGRRARDRRVRPAGAGMLTGVTRAASRSCTCPTWAATPSTVIDPRTYKVVRTFPVPAQPQHVVPSWDLKTLWVNTTGATR